MPCTPRPEDVIQGKAGYMSPEQARGDALDARADVFAAGIVLWELLAGRRLYRLNKDGGPGPSLLDQARAAVIPDLPSRGLPREEQLLAIVKKALAPAREDRYPSAQAMLRELEQYVAESKLIASSIKFGEWLLERYGEDVLQQRRARALAEVAPPSLARPVARPPSLATPPLERPPFPRSEPRGRGARCAPVSRLGPVTKPAISPITLVWMLLAAVSVIVGALYLFASHS